MPQIVFTHQAINSLKSPPSGTVDYFDIDRPGFGVRVSYGGSRTFFQKYRSPTDIDRNGEGKQRRITIGNFPQLKLKDAFAKRGEILEALEDGKDPQKEKIEAKEAERDSALKIGPDPVTVKEGIAQYVDEYVKKECKPRKRTNGEPFHELEWLFGKHVSPLIGDKRLDEMTRKDFMAMRRRIHKGHGPVMADRAFGAVRAAMYWLYDEEIIDDVPNFRPKRKRRRRQNGANGASKQNRKLEHPEIQALWNDLDTEHQANKTNIFASIVKGLLLTGQRRDEVAGMRRSELDLANRVWSLPPERTKNGLPHKVPLSDAALEIIEAQEPIDGCDYVFSSNGKTPFSGYSANKKRLDQRLQFSERWTLHGLRTTFVTGMNDIGILPHVVEACVNHVSGPSKSGVAGIYNDADYWPQRVDAMNRWADFLAAIVDGTADSNVVPLRAGGE